MTSYFSVTKASLDLVKKSKYRHKELLYDGEKKKNIIWL